MPRVPILAATLAMSATSLLYAMPAGAQSTQPPAVAVPPAATTAAAPEFPQLSLSASAYREVAQDRVVVTLSASQEGAQPGPVQAQVNERLSPVLEKLKNRK
jgi:predicted secreted protein